MISSLYMYIPYSSTFNAFLWWLYCVTLSSVAGLACRFTMCSQSDLHIIDSASCLIVLTSILQNTFEYEDYTRSHSESQVMKWYANLTSKSGGSHVHLSVTVLAATTLIVRWKQNTIRFSMFISIFFVVMLSLKALVQSAGLICWPPAFFASWQVLNGPLRQQCIHQSFFSRRLVYTCRSSGSSYLVIANYRSCLLFKRT